MGSLRPLCLLFLLLVTLASSTEQKADPRIPGILKRQRKNLLHNLDGFPFPSNKSLADFAPDLGGHSLQSLVVSTFRTGSSFFGDMLQSVPGTWYHFEPLAMRGDPGKYLDTIKQLLLCNYSGARRYLRAAREKEYLFSHNTPLWDEVERHPGLSYKPQLLEPFCKMFPWQAMKTVRLYLIEAAKLLEDPDLNVRITYLVRDPRGTLHSRKSLDWCTKSQDCMSPVKLCRILQWDYVAAKKLVKQYPDRVKVVRYEDLALDPLTKGEEIIEFYGLPFEKKVQKFLSSHTGVGHEEDPYSTFRDSKSTAFHWMEDLKYQEVQFIQDGCQEAMAHWGYKTIDNATEFTADFNPLLPYEL